MGEMYDALNTGLKGTAFEPGIVILVAFTALVIWLMTKDSDKKAEQKRQEYKRRQQAELEKEIRKIEADHIDDINPW